MKIEKIKYIAESFGWDLHAGIQGEYITYAVGNLASTFTIGPNYNHDLIAFAAVAKAWMSKRGWTITPIYDQHGHWAFPKWCMRAWKGAGDVICLYNNYDPTDPISEANALIDAIYAALEMEKAT